MVIKAGKIFTLSFLTVAICSLLFSINEFVELNLRKDNVQQMINELETNKKRYHNIKKCCLHPSRNEFILNKIDSIDEIYNNGSLSDNFNFINQTRRLYGRLTDINYENYYSGWYGIHRYKLKKHILNDYYYFGYEDKVMVPGNYTFRAAINGIPASLYDEIPYADTLHIELLKLTVNYDTGNIDTVRATEKIITADYIKPRI